MDTASIDIAATPETVYDLVADVTNMGRWSPETYRCQWLDGESGAREGARFKGWNRQKVGPLPLQWSTTCTVASAERPDEFAFDVRQSGARWTYRFEPGADGGTHHRNPRGWRQAAGGQGVQRRGAQPPRALRSGMRETSSASRRRPRQEGPEPPVDRRRRLPAERVESVVFGPSPLARAGIQGVLLVVAVPAAFKASALASHGAGVVLAFLVVATAIAAPVFLDLWAVVKADGHGINWRNRSPVTRSLTWDAVAGFERGATSMALRRADGRVIPLRALGLRYFGSKRLATQRVQILERLKASAAGS
ncbi:MAG: SRPBCC family protein [Acidimicrobiales bacterium]